MNIFSDLFNKNKPTQKELDDQRLLERTQLQEQLRTDMSEAVMFIYKLSQERNERMMVRAVNEDILSVSFHADKGRYAGFFYLCADRSGKSYVIFKAADSLLHEAQVMLGFDKGEAPGTVHCATPEQAITAMCSYMIDQIGLHVGASVQGDIDIIVDVASRGAPRDPLAERMQRLQEAQANLREAAEKLLQATDTVSQAGNAPPVVREPVTIRALPIVGVTPRTPK